MNLKFFYIGLDGFRVICRFAFRSSLIMLASALGIGGVIVSVNYAAGGRREALNQISRMGVNALTVVPLQDRGAAGRARTGAIARTLVLADYHAIRRQIPAIVRASPVASGEFRIKAGDLSKTTQIVGCRPDYPVIKSWSLAEGSWFSEEDDRRAGRVAVIGYRVARDIFGNESPVGRTLFVDRTPFRIVAVLEERGPALDVVSEDDQVYLPLQTAMHRVMNVTYFSGMLLEVSRVEEMDEAASRVESLLRSRHHHLANLPDDFQVRNQKTLIDMQISSSRQLGFYVRLIGIGGLAVSGLGILAISWIAAKGRTIEIGTRRALGAQVGDVFAQILLEATLLSLLGCVLGLLIGWEGSQLLSANANVAFEFDWFNARSAVFSAVLMNIGFAMIPASRSARVSPISALRHE